MNKKTIWFSAFRKVVPADFEEWMENLAKDGWNIDKLGQFGAFKIKLHKTEPKTYRYVFDLNVCPKKDYKHTYEQFGWEYVGRMSSCFVWRKEYTDVRPESFSDRESLIQRNKRLKNAFCVILIMMLVPIAAALVGGSVLFVNGDVGKAYALIPFVLFFAGISIYLSWVIRQLNKNLER
ncbi:MAG: DUF2812 domain-containing protein [Chloroflexi bacterium]|nr:DUF2812 domain-containing protein [Chloroflexota bacterium]